MAKEPYYIGSEAILVPLNFTDSGIIHRFLGNIKKINK